MSSQSIPAPPSWESFFATVGNQEWLTAKALLELNLFGAVRRDAERWLRHSKYDGHLDDSGTWQWAAELDWEAWVENVEEHGRGWCGSEWRLFEVVAGLTTGRPFNIVGVLDRMGESGAGVWRILAEWGTGGSNRDHAGPSTASPAALPVGARTPAASGAAPTAGVQGG